jgi:hypothetical protein
MPDFRTMRRFPPTFAEDADPAENRTDESARR